MSVNIAAKKMSAPSDRLVSDGSRLNDREKEREENKK